MQVVGLDHIVVNTQDIERAMSFYHELLGLELLRWGKETYADTSPSMSPRALPGGS
jgi:catechol 2,3-dioxygenase-like lactoylglutathione lyase family enzyme